MARQQKRLGELLIEWGAVTPKDVTRALEHAKKQNLRIGEALIDLKLVNDTAVYKALAQQHNMEYVDLDKSSIAPNTIASVPDDLMRKYLIIPLGKENGKLRIAVHDPLDLEMLDILRFRMNTEIRTVLAPRSRIKNILDDLFQTTAQNTIDKTVDKSIDAMRQSLDRTLDKSVDRSLDRSIDKSIDVDNIEDTANDPTQAPIIKLVQAMIAEAVRSRASDIHIEPMKDRVRVRYRIDGECVERDRIPLRMKGPLISRIKIMAGIDIAEKRLPQDGRIKLKISGREIDVRVSIIPMIEVAWCDGDVAPEERDAVLNAAIQHGIHRNTASHDLLKKWLEERPDPRILLAWKDYVGELAHIMPKESLAQTKKQVLDRCRRVAAAAGGFLGLSTISKHEQAKIDELARAMEG